MNFLKMIQKTEKSKILINSNAETSTERKVLRIFALKTTSDPQLQVQHGPSILKTTSPDASLTSNRGSPRMFHCYSINLMTLPGGDDISKTFYFEEIFGD